MCGPSVDRDPFEQLAEEFAERLRHGEHPPLSDYIALPRPRRISATCSRPWPW